MRRWLTIGLGTCAVWALWAQAPRPAEQAPAGAPIAITVDAAAPAHTFPHYWERVFGSGRATLSLRESYRSDLRMLKRVTQVRYVRFHNILSDESGLYDTDRNGLPVYNYTYIDQIYDGLLNEGVKPFVELSFMPSKLAANLKPHPFWYKPIPSPPKDYNRWDGMILALMRHLIDRYGIAEVASWYFEVWNEPNIDFWDGVPAQSTYFELYDHTASSIKAVSPQLRVGGPATAQAAWVATFLEHCSRNRIPVDFVSTHVYGNEKPMDVFGVDGPIDRRDMVIRSARKVFDEVKHSALPNVEIHWTEYNATYMNEIEVTDSPYMGAWLAGTIAGCDGLTTTMSYWTFSDVFEEQGVTKQPFYGGYGLIAEGGVPKAAFNAFALLDKLGFDRVANDSANALVTKRADGSLAIAVWNYADPAVEGESHDFSVTFKNLPDSATARVTIVDRDHGSPLRAWQDMGSPRFPNQAEYTALRRAGAMPEAQPLPIAGVAHLTLAPKSLALIEVSK